MATGWMSPLKGTWLWHLHYSYGTVWTKTLFEWRSPEIRFCVHVDLVDVVRIENSVMVAESAVQYRSVLGCLVFEVTPGNVVNPIGLCGCLHVTPVVEVSIGIDIERCWWGDPHRGSRAIFVCKEFPSISERDRIEAAGILTGMVRTFVRASSSGYRECQVGERRAVHGDWIGAVHVEKALGISKNNVVGIGQQRANHQPACQSWRDRRHPSVGDVSFLGHHEEFVDCRSSGAAVSR